MTALIDIDEIEDLEAADLFCGAGGFSTGLIRALKKRNRNVHLRAVNHWPIAIDTHRRNHPLVDHYVQDVTLVNPLDIVPGGFLDMLLASPECTYHSTARGGKPIHDQKRMDPWAVVRWLTVLDVRCLIVENVPEYVNWGPLCTMQRGHEGRHHHDKEARPAIGDERCDRPDPKYRGLYFEAWHNAIVALGYDVQWRNLNAADFGGFTTRVRFFMVARKDSRPVVWPEPTHSKAPDPMYGRRKWRAAREVINWKRRRQSIFDRKKPLALNTRYRMAEGFTRYAGPLAPLYIALLELPADDARPGAGRLKPFVMGKQASPSYRDVDEPMMTLTTESAPSLVEPVVELIGGNRSHNVPRPVEEPMATATSAPGGGLYRASAEAFVLGQQSGGAPRSAEDPMMTIASSGALALVEPLILPYYGNSTPRPAAEPLATVTTRDRFSLMQALVIPYGPKAAARDVEDPMPTVMPSDRLALAEADITPFVMGKQARENPTLRGMDEPLMTLTSDSGPSIIEPVAEPFILQGAPHTKETVGVRSAAEPIYTITTNHRLQVVEPAAFIVPHWNEREGQAPRVHNIEDPAPTVTSRGAGSLVEPHVITTDQTGGNGAYVRPISQPLATLTTKANQAVAEPVLLQVNHGIDARSGERVRSVDDPMWTLTTKRNVMLAEPIVEEIRAGRIDKRRLVVIEDVAGKPHLCMLDIRYGMLENDELARAMGFTNDEFTYEFTGTKGDVTKQIGNAVDTHVAEALIGVNIP